MDPVRAHVAILSVAGSSVRTEVAIENIIADALTGAGHEVTSFETVRDSEVAIRAQLLGWIEDPDVDLVIIVGEGQATTRALNTLVDERLPGFADLLRMVAFQAVGAGAMLSSPEAVRCGQTFVFVLPAGEKAARAAMDKLILPQLDPATTPHNLVDKLPRLREDGDVTRVDNASGPADRIPVPVAAEKTATGRPFPLRPPAKPLAPRAKSRTNQNILRPAKVEDPTKPIELVKLEQQIEMSKPVPEAPPPADRTKPLDLSAPALTPSAAMRAATDDTHPAVGAPMPKVFPPVPSPPPRETPRGITAVSPTATTPLTPSVTEWAAEPALPTRSGSMPVVRPPKPTPPPSPAPPPRPTPLPASLPSLARKTPQPIPAVTPPATLPRLEPPVRTTAMQGAVAEPPARPTPLPSLKRPADPDEAPTIPARSRPADEAPTTPAPRTRPPTAPPQPRSPATPVPSSIIGVARTRQPTPAPAVVVIPPRETPRTRQPTPPVPTRVVIPPREEPPVPATMITTPPPAPRPRQPTPPVPIAAVRPRQPTPPVPIAARQRLHTPVSTRAVPDERLAMLPKLPPGASGEWIESDLLESADDLPAVAPSRPSTEPADDLVELLPAARKPEPAAEPPKPRAEAKPPVEPAELPKPRPAVVPVERVPDPAPRARSGTAPVDPLPQGTFTYPAERRRSRLPLAIALLLLAAMAGAAVVLVMNRSKPVEKQPDTVAQRPASAMDAAEAVAALDAAIAEPDAAEVEIVVETPDAALATQRPKPPRDAGPRVAARPDAATRVATLPVDAAPRVTPPPVDAAIVATTPPDAAPVVVAPPPDAAPPPVVVAEGCDETTCVLESYAKPCCARWKPKGHNFGDVLEKSQIRSGVERVKPAVIACGEKSSAKGTVTIAVTVSPDGAVTSASVASAPDDALGNCVAAALRRATFAKTTKGGSFNYPFVF